MLGNWLRRVWHGFAERRARRGRAGRPSSAIPRFPIGAACLIRDEAGRVLLVLQSYRHSTVWMPPGGWVDRGETPQEAARREAWEEVGLRVEVGRPLAVSAGGYGEITILFECRLLGEPAVTLSHEIDEADFFPTDDLPPLTDATRAWIEEALAALGPRE
ncbi:MAG: NUDIX domain-containing protein [Chloroflexota bacterium]